MMMKRLYLSVLVLLTAVITVSAQSMTDEQILKYVKDEVATGTSESEIAAKLMQRGVTVTQMQNVKQKYSQQINRHGLSGTIDSAILNAEQTLREKGKTADNRVVAGDVSDMANQQVETIVAEEAGTRQGKGVFGRNIFNSPSLTFEPQMNIATPVDYVLGPGDQLVINIYGSSQETHVLTITPDGDVVVPLYGPLPVGGLTVRATWWYHSMDLCRWAG